MTIYCHRGCLSSMYVIRDIFGSCVDLLMGRNLVFKPNFSNHYGRKGQGVGSSKTILSLLHLLPLLIIYYWRVQESKVLQLWFLSVICCYAARIYMFCSNMAT